MNKIIVSLILLVLLGFIIFAFSRNNSEIIESDSNFETVVEKIENTENIIEDNIIEKDEIIENIESSNIEEQVEINENINNNISDMNDYRIKISVGDKVMYATLYNNATSKHFVNKLPISLNMKDLYSREMCFNFDESLDTDNVEYRGYELGEIIYWPPANSFVIMYKQNGEKFSMQQVGILDSGVEIFENTGDVEVLFELEK